MVLLAESYGAKPEALRRSLCQMKLRQTLNQMSGIQIGQHLRNYVSPPPKLVRASADQTEEGLVQEVAHSAEVAAAVAVDDTATSGMSRREGDPIE